MSRARMATGVIALSLVTLAYVTATAAAEVTHSGGVQAPPTSLAGGAEYMSLRVHGPMMERFSVSSTVPAGTLPTVVLRFGEAGVRTVRPSVVVADAVSRRVVLRVNVGWTRTKRSIVVRWPKRAALNPGVYRVTVAARDHSGRGLLPNARISSEARFEVLQPVAVAPPPAPSQPPLTAMFPVQGAHSFGGPESRFGAPRAGHTHQGQDVLAAEGTPIVAPLAGAILTTGYQANGAGFYAVEHTSQFDFMFAHCQAGSLAVKEAQQVAAGQLLCKVGQTGDATGPHLHFEAWVGGWQTKTGYPIDPLPYLQEWERQGS